MLKFLYNILYNIIFFIGSYETYQNDELMTNKYRLLFGGIDDDVVTLQGAACVGECYVNKPEIEFGSRPVFALFSGLNSL
jgi:hypothetical protein